MTAPPTVARLPNMFQFLCWDGPQAGPHRSADLDGHLAHVERHWTRYLVAGPLREADGETIIGSMFLVFAETLDDAWALMKGDPYVTNGQYARIDVNHATASIGTAVGGKIWPSADAIRDRATGGAVTS